MPLRSRAKVDADAGISPAVWPGLPQAPLSGAALLLCLWPGSPAMALGCVLGAAVRAGHLDDAVALGPAPNLKTRQR